jgi:acyl-CoA synthetase (AMP-forming)/AMP-acid ligase II
VSRIALVHSLSLLGKEVAERLGQRPDLCSDLRLFALDEAMVGTLTEGLDGAAFVARVEEDCFDGVDLTILCGEIETDRQALALLPPGGRAIVASHGATTRDGFPAVAGVEDGCFFMPDDGEDESITRLAAFVVAPSLTPRRLLDALRGRLDPIFLPRPLVFLDKLPRNDTGKLPRTDLQALLDRHAKGAA